MTRKLRIRLTIVLVAIGIPLVLVAIVAFLAVTRQLGSWVSIEYAKRLPGHLRIGSLQFTASDRIHLTDIAIAEGFAKPLFTAASADATIDLFSGRLRALTLHGAHMRLDEGSYDLLNRIIDAQEHIPPSNPPQEWQLSADGTAEFGSGLRIGDITVQGPVRGSLFELTCAARFTNPGGTRPMRVTVASRPIATPTPGVPASKRVSIELTDVEGPVPEALDALACVGLLPPAPPELKRWLPAVIDASGSVINRDLGILRFTAPARVRWTDAQGRAGSLAADLEADAGRIAVAIAHLDDPALGRIGSPGSPRTSGLVTVDLRAKTIAFDAPRFIPGPGLGIPSGIAVDALLKQVPRIAVRYGIANADAVIELVDADRSGPRLAVIRGNGTPLRLEAAQLPLTVAQGFMPAGVTLAGGQITAATVTVRGDAPLAKTELLSLRLQVDQARGTWRSWSVGPLSGTLAVAPQADGSSTIDATLPTGTVSIRGQGGAGSAKIRIQTVDALLARLHGPIDLPAVSGALEVDLGWSRAPDQQLVIAIPRAAIDRAGVSFLGGDLLQGVTTVLKGEVRVAQSAAGAPAVLQIKAGGQLTAGQLAAGKLRLPTQWLDLATKTPIFTVDAEVRTGAEAHFALRELLLRAADAAGTPRQDSYSAQFSGTLDGSGNGTIDGLVDHADLGWVNRQIGLPNGAVDGQGAVTCQASVSQAQMVRVTGHFLPLNAEVAIGSRFHASGITGAIDFAIDHRPDPDTPAQP